MENVGIFMIIWNTLWTCRIFYGHSGYFVAILNIWAFSDMLWPYILVYFTRFG
jgi:hypothetical protein